MIYVIFLSPAVLNSTVHLGGHLKNKETLKCPFQLCQFKSSVYSTFTAHKSRYHCSSGLKDLRAELICDYSPSTATSGEHAEIPIDCGISPSDCEEDTEENGDSIKLRLASLFLRMQAILHISKSATQEIVNELYEIGVLAGEFTNRSIENVLRQHNFNPDSSILALVTETLQETNPLYLLSKTGPFGTDHKRSSFFRNNFRVIEPVEYILDAADRKKTFV